MPRFVAAFVVCLAAVAALSWAAAEDDLSAVKVREDHPRIWMTPERVEALKAKMKSEPIPGSDAATQGLKYILSGDEAAGAEAAKFMLSFDLSEEALAKTGSDEYRWSAAIPIIYDWCRPLLTPDERAQFTERYGRIAKAMNAKSWGGYDMPGSNYYAGYMRNSAIFGLAAWEDTPVAKECLADALIRRWRERSLPYLAGPAKGGITGEGSQYDRYNIGYTLWLAEALRTAAGIDITKDTNWFREFAYYTLYSTTPAPAPVQGKGDPYFQRFPFGDCEMWKGHPAVEDFTGDAMRYIALAYPEENVGRHAMWYVEEVEPPQSIFSWVVEDGRTVDSLDWEGLPLDYYAPGVDFVYAKGAKGGEAGDPSSGWGEDATTVMLQLGVAEGGSHQHLDAGTFQIARSGSWITKESTGYNTKFKGTDSRGALAHNSVLINGRGHANAYPDGRPEVVALQTHPFFFHAAVDLSKAYRATKSSRLERDDNPEAVKCIREFLYIRPDVLIIFDRLESATPEAEKTFVLHMAGQPKWEEGQKAWVMETSGGQLTASVVYPENAPVKFVDEGDVEGKKADPGFYQWRMEASQKGTKESYFLTVVAGQMRFDLPPTCKLVESTDAIGADISQPGRRTQVWFNKKTGESLGKLIIDAAGAYGHAESSLPAKVQDFSVGPDGPAWGAKLE